MFQQIILLGRIGADPELRETGSGTPVCNFPVAVSRMWTNSEGERKEKTIWFRVTCWRGLAETVARYMSKGREIMVLGEMEEPEIYTNRNGEQATNLSVTAQSVKFLGGGSNGQSSNSEQATRSRSANNSRGAKTRKETSEEPEFMDDEDVPW